MPVLVYHAGALGDLVTALPAVAAFRARHPGEPVWLLGRPGLAAVAAGQVAGGVVARLLDVESPPWSGLYGPGVEATGALAGVEAALVFAAKGSPLVAGLHRAGVRDLTVVSPTPAPGCHVVDHHLQALGLHPCGTARPSLLLDLPDRPRHPTLAVLQAGSGSRVKNWAGFPAVAGWLAGQGLEVVWNLGPAEEGMALPAGACALTGLEPVGLARVLAQAALCVGNDSGVTHLAAAAGCPTVAVFGPSDPRVWGPRGAVVVDGGQGMACRPCVPGTQGARACGGARTCLASVTAEVVVAACRQAWGREP
jgi:ADP-heptose:LPS heptosyltransferase